MLAMPQPIALRPGATPSGAAIARAVAVERPIEESGPTQRRDSASLHASRFAAFSQDGSGWARERRFSTGKEWNPSDCAAARGVEVSGQSEVSVRADARRLPPKRIRNKAGATGSSDCCRAEMSCGGESGARRAIEPRRAPAGSSAGPGRAARAAPPRGSRSRGRRAVAAQPMTDRAANYPMRAEMPGSFSSCGPAVPGRNLGPRREKRVGHWGPSRWRARAAELPRPMRACLGNLFCWVGGGCRRRRPASRALEATVFAIRRASRPVRTSRGQLYAMMAHVHATLLPGAIAFEWSTAVQLQWREPF